MVSTFPEVVQDPKAVPVWLPMSRGEAELGPLYREKKSQQDSRFKNVVEKMMRSVGVGLVMVTSQTQLLP